MIKAVEELKRILAKLPTFQAPRNKEKLNLYVASSESVVSAVLVTEEAEQKLVFYCSRVVNDTE